MTYGNDETPRLSEDVLSAYVDGELSASDRKAVEARLANDELWRHILDDVSAARDLIRHLPDREPPTGFWLRVLTNVAEVAEADPLTGVTAAVVPIARPAARRVPRWSAIAGAAAAVVVGVAVAAPTHPHHVSPNVATMADSHAATASLQSGPLNLAPAAVPVTFNR